MHSLISLAQRILSESTAKVSTSIQPELTACIVEVDCEEAAQ